MIGSSIPAHAAYFSIFEACKQTFGAAGPEHTPIASGNFWKELYWILRIGAAGIGATVAHDMIMTPMDVVKQRLQLGYYTGTLNCMKTVRESLLHVCFLKNMVLIDCTARRAACVVY